MSQLSTIRSTPHMSMVVTGLVFLGSAALALYNQWWPEALTATVLVPLVATPWLAERWAGVKVPLSIQIQYAVLISAGPYLGGYWNWYEAWSPWDTLVHCYSGFVISFVLVIALGKTIHTYQLHLPVWLEMVVLITVKAFIALLWEIAEFVFDLIFDASAQLDNTDTMTDMIVALAPSVLIAGALYAHRRKGSFTYVGDLLEAARGQE